MYGQLPRMSFSTGGVHNTPAGYGLNSGNVAVGQGQNMYYGNAVAHNVPAASHVFGNPVTGHHQNNGYGGPAMPHNGPGFLPLANGSQLNNTGVGSLGNVAPPTAQGAAIPTINLVS